MEGAIFLLTATHLLFNRLLLLVIYIISMYGIHIAIKEIKNKTLCRQNIIRLVRIKQPTKAMEIIMKHKNTITKLLFASTFITILISAATTMGFTDKEIFNWVANELNIQNRYEMPAIQYVTKEKLGEAFKNNNKKSFKRWADQYGEEKASELINFYISEVIGLYIPKTNDLYVGDFIEPCIKESIVAHELTHFFQTKKDGPVNSVSPDAGNVHLYREMQASNLERKFIEEFCKTPESESIRSMN